MSSISIPDPEDAKADRQTAKILDDFHTKMQSLSVLAKSVLKHVAQNQTDDITSTSAALQEKIEKLRQKKVAGRDLPHVIWPAVENLIQRV